MTTNAVTATVVALAIMFGLSTANAAENQWARVQRVQDVVSGPCAAVRAGEQAQAQRHLRLDRALRVRIEKGEVVDFAIIGEGAIDALVKQGKLDAATRAVVARSGLGVAIRKGAPKPDLSSTEAFKRTIINAKSIGFNKGGLSGIYLWSLFDRLGVADMVKAKFTDGSGATLAGTGKTELGFTQASDWR